VAQAKLFEVSERSEPEFSVRKTKRTAFALLDGKPALFNEPTQKLYALNSLAALIWCRLEENGRLEAARADLMEAGVERKLAARYVEDAVTEWLRLGLLRADCARPRETVGFQVDGVAHSIETSSFEVSRAIAALFDPHSCAVEAAAAAHFDVIEVEGLPHVYFKEALIGVCKPDELAPTVKAVVTAGVLSREREDIVFHAACLSRGDKVLLASGAPGSGKTTLALQLAARGFGYASDDITLVALDGSARGVPFAPTVKSGAWDIVGGIAPELAGAPIHCRPDGKRVRYLPLQDFDPNSRPVGWIVFLNRRPEAAVDLVPVDAVEAMRRIIEGSYTSNRRLSLAGFGALRRMLAGAKALELNYASAAEAADAIAGFCTHVA
jgi:hypothetical protein